MEITIPNKTKYSYEFTSYNKGQGYVLYNVFHFTDAGDNKDQSERYPALFLQQKTADPHEFILM